MTKFADFGGVFGYLGPFLIVLGWPETPKHTSVMKAGCLFALLWNSNWVLVKIHKGLLHILE